MSGTPSSERAEAVLSWTGADGAKPFGFTSDGARALARDVLALSARAEQLEAALGELETMAENHQANVDRGDDEGHHVGSVTYERGLVAGIRTAVDDIRAALGGAAVEGGGDGWKVVTMPDGIPSIVRSESVSVPLPEEAE